LPEDEKQTLRDLRKETTRRFNEGFLSQDNAGKNIDQVFSEYQERQKMALGGRLSQFLTCSSFLSSLQ
jgi:hypothetical protein